MLFTLQGSPIQRQIIQTAIRRCDFPFEERLLAGLREQTGRSTIPVDWQDLSRYASIANTDEIKEGRLHKTTVAVIEQDGDKATLIEWRHRVLGLAWYSGRITLDVSLTREPDLAAEVFLSECAHMWDFFGMTMEERVRCWNAFHSADQDLPLNTIIEDGVDLGHGHGWFDVGDYYTWVGEALMGGFVMAFSDYRVSMQFPHHSATPAIAKEIRAIVFPAEQPEQTVIEPVVEEPVQPEVVEPGPVEPSPLPSPEEPIPQPEPTPEPEPEPPLVQPEPEPEPQPEPEPEPQPETEQYSGLKRSKVFHENDCRIIRGKTIPFHYESKEAAEAAGRRGCKVCKP